MSEVYWRVYRDNEDSVVFPCMQDFDEMDYNQENFLTEDKFESEARARGWYNHIKTAVLLELLKLRTGK